MGAKCSNEYPSNESYAYPVHSDDQDWVYEQQQPIPEPIVEVQVPARADRRCPSGQKQIPVWMERTQMQMNEPCYHHQDLNINHENRVESIPAMVSRLIREAKVFIFSKST